MCLQPWPVSGAGLKVRQIRPHINGSIFFQLKDAIDSGLLVCMGKQQMSEKCSELFLPPRGKAKGVEANRAALYTHVLTQINQIINKFVILRVGIPDKGRLSVAMR